MALCQFGKYDADDVLKVCIHLSFSKDGQASCKLMALGFNPFEYGCSFQHDKAYSEFVLMYAKFKEHLTKLSK